MLDRCSVTELSLLQGLLSLEESPLLSLLLTSPPDAQVLFSIRVRWGLFPAASTQPALFGRAVSLTPAHAIL